MSKRFTETAKWSDPWFRSLSTRHKALWQWLLDNCDCAGVLGEIDWGLVSFQIGESCSIDDMVAFTDRVEPCGKGWWVTKFVVFQVGQIEEDTLSKPHRGVLKALAKASIPLERAMQTLTKPLPKGFQTLKDKDKDKDKDQDKDLVLVAQAQAEIPIAAQTPSQADAVWMLYPKKSGKKQAWPEIEAAIKAHGFEKIRSAVAAYADAVARWPAEEQIYVPDPVRWFKRGHYDDDPAAWDRKTKKSGGTSTYELEAKAHGYTL